MSPTELREFMEMFFPDDVLYIPKDDDVNMTVLKPVLATACLVARYFNRDENKSERVKQAVLDVELLFKERGIADVLKAPAAK